MHDIYGIFVCANWYKSHGRIPHENVRDFVDVFSFDATPSTPTNAFAWSRRLIFVYSLGVSFHRQFRRVRLVIVWLHYYYFFGFCGQMFAMWTNWIDSIWWTNNSVLRIFFIVIGCTRGCIFVIILTVQKFETVIYLYGGVLFQLLNFNSINCSNCINFTRNRWIAVMRCILMFIHSHFWNINCILMVLFSVSECSELKIKLISIFVRVSLLILDSSKCQIKIGNLCNIFNTHTKTY